MRRSGQTIVALLIAVAILVVLYLMFLRKPSSSLGVEQKSLPRAAIDKASGVACRNNLDQIRKAIMMYEQTNEKRPATLQEVMTQGVTRDMLWCPVTRRPYTYNPKTGTVKCPTPEHAAF